MKNHWKMLAAVIVIAAGATGLALNSRTRGSGCGGFEAIVPGGVRWRGELFG